MNFFRKTLLWKWMVLLWLEYCVKNFVCTNIYNVGIYNFCNMIKVNQTAEFILSFFQNLWISYLFLISLKSQAISAVCLLSYHQILNKKNFVHKIFRQKHNKNSLCFWSTATTIFWISNYLLPEGLTSTLNLLSGVTIP